MDNEQRRQFEKTAREEFDRAQRVANKRLRKWLTEGAIAAFVRDPEHDQTLQLPRDGWDGLSEFEDGLTANFVGPDDPQNCGPNTVVGGKRRPVFLFAVNWRSWFGQSSVRLASAADKGGRPPEHNWDAVKAHTLAMIREHGFPGRGNRKFPSKTQLVEEILNKWAFQGLTLAPSSVRRYVNRWLKEL